MSSSWSGLKVSRVVKRLVLCERGAISIYWILLMLLVLEFLIFSRTILHENVVVSLEGERFAGKKLELENLEEQSRVIGCLLMEEVLSNTVDYMDKNWSEGGMEPEKLEEIYTERLEFASSKLIGTTEGPRPMDESYMSGLAEFPEVSYGYSEEEKLRIEVEKVESIGGSKRRKKYGISYFLGSDGDDIGYTVSPVYLVMDYPSYAEAVGGKIGFERVFVVKRGEQEGLK